MACTSALSISRLNKESLEDCMCTICLCILVHPVTLPCGHELCMPCFKQTVEEASLTCPLCRTRISTWARKAAKAKTLVDQKRWEQIQRLFPQRVQRRLDGLDDETDEEIEEKEEVDVSYRRMVQLSKPGEIRKEYEAELKRLADLQEEERRREEEASAALIRSLRSKETAEFQEIQRQQEVIAAKDAQLAHELGRVINEAESETPVNRMLQGAKANYPDRCLSCSNSSTPTLHSHDNSDRGKQLLVKNSNKTLETFFRRLPAGTRTLGRSWSEPKPASSECHREKTGLASVNLRSFSVPVRDKENLPHVGAADLSDICEAVEVGEVYSRDRVLVEEIETGQPYAKDFGGIQRSESVLTVHSDGSDSVIICEQAEWAEGKDGRHSHVAHFQPIQWCPRTPPRSVALAPCVVRITPRNLFSTSCLSSTSFPVLSSPPVSHSSKQPPALSGGNMGAVTSTLLSELRFNGVVPGLPVNGSIPLKEDFPKRPRSCSPPASKPSSPQRRMSYDDTQKSPYARASLDDFRQREDQECAQTGEVRLDSRVASLCSKLRGKSPVSELSRAVQSLRDLHAGLGSQEPALVPALTKKKEGSTSGDGKVLTSGLCRGLGSNGQSISPKPPYTKLDFLDGIDADSSEYGKGVVRSPPQPSTSAVHAHSEVASSGGELSPSKPVGIFNPATVPSWSQALYVDTFTGKGKRLVKKSTSSSISDRNSPKRTGKFQNHSRPKKKVVGSEDSSVQADGGATPASETPPACREDGAVSTGEERVSAALHRTAQKGSDSDRTAVGVHAPHTLVSVTDSDQTATDRGSTCIQDMSGIGMDGQSCKSDNCGAIDSDGVENPSHISKADHPPEKPPNTNEPPENKHGTNDKVVLGVRRGKRRKLPQNSELSEPEQKVSRHDKNAKLKSAGSDKSRLGTGNQRSIKDWFSPKQMRDCTSKTSIVVASSRANSQKKTQRERTTSENLCGHSVVSTSSSSAVTSPQKLGMRISSRARKLSSKLDSLLLSDTLQQLQRSPSKESNTSPDSPSKPSPHKRSPSKATTHKGTPSKISLLKRSPSKASPSKSSPAKNLLSTSLRHTPSKPSPSKTTPSKGRKRALPHTDHKDSPAKMLKLTPSNASEKAGDCNSCHKGMEDDSSSEDEKGFSQEEKDLRLAMRLQRQFDLADKLKLKILRFKGTDDQYSLRAGHSTTHS